MLSGSNQRSVDTILSYLGQMVMKKAYKMQSIHIAMTESQQMIPKGEAFMES